MKVPSFEKLFISADILFKVEEFFIWIFLQMKSFQVKSFQMKRCSNEYLLKLRARIRLKVHLNISSIQRALATRGKQRGWGFPPRGLGLGNRNGLRWAESHMGTFLGWNFYFTFLSFFTNYLDERGITYLISFLNLKIFSTTEKSCACHLSFQNLFGHKTIAKTRNRYVLCCSQTFRELIPKELNSKINSNFLQLRLELNLF